MLAGIKHWPYVFSLQHPHYFYNFPLPTSRSNSQSWSNKCSWSILLHKYHFQKISILPIHSLLEVLGTLEGGGIVKDQKRKEVISRGVLQVCKINKSKERARIQHSIGHLRVIQKNYFRFITRTSAQLTIDIKLIFYYDVNKTHFHMNGCTLSLVLKPIFF